MEQFVRISLVGGGIYIQPLDELINLLDEIKDAEAGEEWHIQKIEMTKEDYEDLPEFMGH